MTISTAGRLLLATPPLQDPNFDRSVVLVLDHDPEGAVGLVLNQPTGDDGVDGLGAWFAIASTPAVVFRGGPVDDDTLIGLASGRAGGGDGWAPLRDGLGTVDLEADPEDVGAPFTGLRIFRGYAGWGPGQLDDELAEGAWIVVDRDIGDAFCDAPHRLWRAVLRRQGGRLAWLAECPDDLRVN